MKMPAIIKMRRKESGSVIVIFAVSLSVLISFVSFAIDIGIVNMKKARMMDMCQQMRTARIDAKDYIMNSKEPGRLIYDISNQCAIENGFKGELKVYYQETVVPGASTNWVDSRTYYVRIELKQEHQFIFPIALVANEKMKVRVFLDGGEQKTSKRVTGEAYVPVWSPGSVKNGSWARTDPMGSGEPDLVANDWPDDFTY